jgi:hypothetical protein
MFNDIAVTYVLLHQTPRLGAVHITTHDPC